MKWVRVFAFSPKALTSCTPEAPLPMTAMRLPSHSMSDPGRAVRGAALEGLQAWDIWNILLVEDADGRHQIADCERLANADLDLSESPLVIPVRLSELSVELD